MVFPGTYRSAIGEVRFLGKLVQCKKDHLNEGHTAFATLEIANKNNWNENKNKEKVQLHNPYSCSSRSRSISYKQDSLAPSPGNRLCLIKDKDVTLKT
jgi:hypothetical protein